MSTLDERLASRLGNDSIPGKKSPFDEPTHALQKRFDISSYGIKGASVDHGFAEGAVGIELGAAAERELMEFDRKKDAWRTVKAWFEDGSERERKTRWMLVAYRHTLHTFDNPPYWNLFNGLLFSDATATRWLSVDYHESNKEYRAIPVTARNQRTKQRSNELFGMLLYLGNPPPEYVAATWIGPNTSLHPHFLANLPSSPSTPGTTTKIPSEISYITTANYVPSFTWDDMANITTSIVIALGSPDEAEEFGGESRVALIVRKGCQSCGKDDMERRMLCGACKGPGYCSPECQKREWKKHKPVCKRQVELYAQPVDDGAEIVGQGKKGGHVHEAGCKHNHH